MILPQKLAAFYPIEVIPSIWQIVVSVLLVGVISIVVLRAVQLAPYLLIGWLWYLGTLFPVIGLVQAGMQSMADRFTYIPLIGLFMAIVWGLSALFQGLKYRNIILTGLTVIVLLDLACATRRQSGYWKNTLTLFQHTTEVTENNWLAHYKCGVEFSAQERFHEALYHFEEAIRIRPTYSDALTQAGLTLIKLGRYEESLKHFQKALKVNLNVPWTYNYMGFSLAKLGRYKEALQYLDEAVRINPEYSEALKNAEKIKQKLRKQEGID
jgi:tetratricopeptide (TPR) repeat protein